MAEARRDALRDVKRILEDGKMRVKAELADMPSEFQAWQLPKIQQSIDRALGDVGDALAQRGAAAASTGHALGKDLVDAPIEAAGIQISTMMPEIDVRQLIAIRTFLIDRMKDVTREVAGKIKSQIGLVMVGALNPAEAVSDIAAMVDGGRSRATTIVRTEMGRAFSVATQERQTQAMSMLPGLKKQWRRSGKVHSRLAHDLADGQIVEVDKPFIVDGEELMYPRDPAASAKQTINCGCVQLPFMEHWEVRQPGRQPFSDDEVFRNPAKRDLARELNPPIRHANIEELERLSTGAARRQIAEDLASDGFRSFVSRIGGEPEQRAVAVLPEDISGLLGSRSPIVRLSSYTVTKQRARRRKQDFSAADYARLQDMIDNGSLVLESDTHILAYRREGAVIWKGVLKRTEAGDEVYLQSLHRSNAKQRRIDTAAARLIREENE